MSTPVSPLILILGGAIVGIAIWVLLKPRPVRHEREVGFRRATTVTKVYDPPKPLNELTKVDPLPEPSQTHPPPPTFYTQDHYDGPMGVPVPEGVLKDYPAFGRQPSVNPQMFASSVFGPGFHLGRPPTVTSSYVLGYGRPVTTEWTKLGLLVNGDQLLDLYGRPIAPLQDLFEYQVQDLNGFNISLNQTRLLEDGDKVVAIPGKPGTWVVHIPKRYIWV